MQLENSTQNSLPSEVTFILGGLLGGGAERVAIQLMEAWLKKGVSVNLITMRGPEKDKFAVPVGVNRIILGGEGDSKNKLIALSKNLWYVFKVRRAIKKIRAQTIISFLTRTNIYAIISCIGLNKYIIISERNDTTKQPLGWPWATLRRKLYRYADVVTANSGVAVSSMKDYVPGEKLKFVPNPLKIPDSEVMSTPDRSNILLNVGRLTAHKSQSLIIQAFSSLHNEFGGWSLAILGEGEERNNLEKQADQLNVNDKLVMPGFVQNVSDYYRDAAIFLLPSKYEGTPNALLEAMAFGLPCVISDSLPGALELIEDGESGFVFKNGDVEDLQDKIRFLIENPGFRVKMGKAARNTVRKFGTENAIKNWEELFR